MPLSIDMLQDNCFSLKSCFSRTIRVDQYVQMLLLFCSVLSKKRRFVLILLSEKFDSAKEKQFGSTSLFYLCGQFTTGTS